MTSCAMTRSACGRPRTARPASAGQRHGCSGNQRDGAGAAGPRGRAPRAVHRDAVQTGPREPGTSMSLRVRSSSDCAHFPALCWEWRNAGGRPRAGPAMPERVRISLSSRRPVHARHGADAPPPGSGGTPCVTARVLACWTQPRPSLWGEALTSRTATQGKTPRLAGMLKACLRQGGSLRSVFQAFGAVSGCQSRPAGRE